MKAFAEHWSRLRNRAVRGLMRTLFTEEAIGMRETPANLTPTNEPSRVGAEQPSKAAGAAPAQADWTRTNVSRPEQG